MKSTPFRQERGAVLPESGDFDVGDHAASMPDQPRRASHASTADIPTVRGSGDNMLIQGFPGLRL